jgi:hypothetical protein
MTFAFWTLFLDATPGAEFSGGAPTTHISGFAILLLVILWLAFSRGRSSNAVRRMGTDNVFDSHEPESEEEEEEWNNPNII